MDTPVKLDNMFCEKCNNIYDIRKHKPINDTVLDSKTPDTVTNSDTEIPVDYKKIIKKIENKENPTKEELNSIVLTDLINNSYYKKLTKKNTIKKAIIDMIDDMENNDNNKQGYLICNNCHYSKTLLSSTKIMSINPNRKISEKEYINESIYRNRIHCRTVPRTRNFNCPNLECPSKKNKIPTEAIFFRKNNFSYETIYVCCYCKTVKIL